MTTNQPEVTSRPTYLTNEIVTKNGVTSRPLDFTNEIVTKNGVTFRPLNPSTKADVAELSRLFADYFIDDYKFDLSRETVVQKIVVEQILPNLKSRLSDAILAFYGGETVGFSIYQLDTPESDWCKRPGWGFIREFFVVPSMRRKGVGAAMADETERALRDLQRSHGTTGTGLYLTSDDAIGFWLSRGYRDTGEVNDNGTHTMEKM